jgi:hypothetical protein
VALPFLTAASRRVALAALAVAAAACHVPGRDQLTGRATDEWVRSYPLEAGGEVQVTNGNGAVEIEAVDGSTVDVRAERIARASNDAAAAEILPRINLREEISPGKISLSSEQLGGIVIGVSTEVRFHVRAPRRALIRIRAVNGPLGARGFAGRSILTAVNGGLTAEDVRGGLEARSTNGNAKVALAAIGTDLVDVRVTNGRLELVVPAAANANVNATVTNGKIDLGALKLEPLGEQTARRVRGRLNAGGTPIEVAVTNGNLVARPD